jgi:hypothetical protein
MLSECELIDTKNISLVEPEYEVCWRVSEANESQASYSVGQANSFQYMNILNHVIFPAKIQISKPIDVPYIGIYVQFKDDILVI